MGASLYLLADRVTSADYYFQVFPGQIDKAIDFFRQIGWYTDIEYARGSRGEHFFATSHPLRPGTRFVEINGDTTFQTEPEFNLVLFVQDLDTTKSLKL